LTKPKSPSAESASSTSARRGESQEPGSQTKRPNARRLTAQEGARHSSATGDKRARVIAIANQKGGVGKSTTAVSLGAALSELGYTVLVLDLDPQGNASTGLGIRHEARAVTVYDVLASEAAIDQAIVPTAVDRLFAIPATIDLAGAEIELVSQFSRELRLRKALDPLREDRFDFVILDCPPSLGLLTVNALAAAEELIVPIQCEYYALEGLGQLLRNVRLVQQNVNPRLTLTGIVLTMFDQRTKLAEQVVEEVRRYFGDRVYDAVIPRTVRLSEAPGYGQPITVYDPESRGAECYRALAGEVAEKLPTDEPLPGFDELPDVVPARDPDPEPVPEADPAPPAADERVIALGEASDAAAETVDVEPAVLAPARSELGLDETTPSTEGVAPYELRPATGGAQGPLESGPDPEPEDELEAWPVAQPDAVSEGAPPVDRPMDPEDREAPVRSTPQLAKGESRKPRWRLFGRGGDR